LYIHASAALGGTEIRSFQLARALQPEFEIQILIHGPSGPIIEEYRRESIPVVQAPFPLPVNAWKTIRRFKPDVVQIFGLRTNLLWRPLLYAMGYRRIIGFIGGLSNTSATPHPLRIALDRLTHRLLATYVANARFLTSQLIDKGFDPQKLRTIFDGIPVSAPPPQASQRNATPTLVCVANLRPIKGHLDLIKALYRLDQKGISFQVWLIGKGSELSHLKQRAADYKLESRVLFLGEVPNADVPNFIRQADIFVLTSHSEGVSGAVMEAMALGRPVIVTRVGGIPELVSDGVEGLVVSAGDVAGIADAIERLITQDTLRQRLGENAYQRVLKDFRIENTVASYRALYHEVLEKRP
jgi:glycosyltransferase involved in cell wall biosynthesis